MLGSRSGTGCPSVSPPWGHKPCQQTCSGVGSSLHRSCWEPAPVWALHGITGSSGHIHLLQRGVLHGLQVDICSTVDLHGLQGNNLPRHGLLLGLQEKNLCSGAQSISLLFTDFSVLQSCFSHRVSLISLDCCSTAVFSPC